MKEEKTPVKRGFFSAIKTILWAFFGVRKRGEYEKDVTQLNPVHVILAGLFSAAIFVILLVVLVNYVVAQ